MKQYFRQFSSLFCQLVVLTILFLLLEISFFIQSLHFYFSDFDHIAHKVDIPSTIIPGILFFVLAQLLTHMGALCIILFLTLSLAFLFKFSPQDREKLGLVLWFLGVLTVFLSNQYFYPHSKFSALSRFLFPDTLALVLLVFLYSFWSVAGMLAAAVLVTAIRFRQKLAVFALGLFLGGCWVYQQYFYRSTDAATEAQPNIILIGVDSLRPDFLAYFGSPLKTQFFSHFLRQATVFSDTFTPLARTFPSWVGILSGVYPKESGVRFNLSNKNPSVQVPLLPTILRQHGYKTIFATDESRFSNIDQTFGFDEVLTPPMGLNDFLVGSFNDFPLSNLVVNTFIGQWLFPHSYASRPVYVTYEPDSFLARLRPYLRQARHQPLFLAVHFCLPHYPYLWASRPSFRGQDEVSHYQASIVRVDQQLNDFMVMLKQYQVLQHALVVLLSDHGEALELSGDRITSPEAFLSRKGATTDKSPRFYPPSADKEAVDQSAGHGTDVLGFPQYHALLAFQLYGLERQSVKKVTQSVMLLDIKPTILDFLKIGDTSSGISLHEVIVGKKSKLLAARRSIFLESDFSPEAIRSVHPETRNLIFEGIELFRIDPHTTRIYVKDSMGQLILSSKQYAIIDQDWVLALYPQDKGTMIPVLVQRSTGKWTTDMSISFAQKSPLKHMLYTLQHFYGTELKPLS